MLGWLLFNHTPEMILQGQDIPIHLGSLIPAMKSVAKYFEGEINDGDLMLHNDPSYGGSHIIDTCMYMPVFYEGELVFWTVCKGHLTDIGGPVPAGYNPNATEIYAEGLRIPPIKIWDKGKPRHDVMNMILSNMRARRDQEGDFNALIGACKVGARALIALMDKYGKDTVQTCIAELLNMAEAHMRSLIAKVPDGTYTGTAQLNLAQNYVNGPNNQGLGWRKRCQSQASRAPAGNRIASQRQSTLPAWEIGVPSPSKYLNAAGTHSTTTSTRRLCPAATWLSIAPLRAPRLTISPEPPGMLEKNAVARSSPVRRINHTPTTAETLVTSAPKKIKPK